VIRPSPHRLGVHRLCRVTINLDGALEYSIHGLVFFRHKGQITMSYMVPLATLSNREQCAKRRNINCQVRIRRSRV